MIKSFAKINMNCHGTFVLFAPDVLPVTVGKTSFIVVTMVAVIFFGAGVKVVSYFASSYNNPRTTKAM